MERLQDQPLIAGGATAGLVALVFALRPCCRRSRPSSLPTTAAQKVVPCAEPEPDDAGGDAPAAEDLSGKGASGAEQAAVAELSRQVRRTGASKADARWYEDAELLRFVRARPSIVEAEALFYEAMAWREGRRQLWGANPTEGSYGADYDAFLAGTKPAPDWFAFLSKHLPQTLYGSDRFGLPIMYSHVGRTDLLGCEREVGFENLQRFGIMMNDSFLDKVRLRNKGQSDVVHGGVVIVDFEGVGVRHLREAGVFNRLAVVAKILHPERQRKCFIINAPSSFAALWRLLQPFIDPRTAARIHIIRASQSNVLVFDELGAENVPTFLGGSFEGLRQPEGSLVSVGAFKEV